jgi:hypothetical protein
MNDHDLDEVEYIKAGEEVIDDTIKRKASGLNLQGNISNSNDYTAF